MKKKIFLSWYGDGPESSNPGTEMVVDVDVADLLDDGAKDISQENIDALDECLEKFARNLQETFGADDSMTERMLADREKWAEEQMRGEMK